jgi:exosome complex exonuclease RRP6
MLRELKQAKEIAVDLEHHDMHSYIGLVSLMQISTREKDWIVDPLKPWRENLQCLNEVFADPNIVKVFHGSNMDMKWLQRDLGLYVVGLFDTYYAAEALNFPGKGLKYLLERFANFKAQKKYQMADWRVRPLPEELVEYARSDTHYLLYIYDELKNMLLEASTPDANLVDNVLEGSKKEALQVYERPIYDVEYGLGSGGWFKQVTQRSIKFDGSQLAVYKAVHYWRDQKAREWDEGEQSILTLAQLYNIADTMPSTVPALYSSLRPISKLVAASSKELLALIKRAKSQGENGPTLRDVVCTTEEKFGPSFVMGRKRKSPPAENQGVGATLQMLTKSGAVTPATAESPESTTIIDDAEFNAGRSLTSRLWGLSLPAPPSINKATLDSSSVALQALKNILPLPKQPDQLPTDGMVYTPMEIDRITPDTPVSANHSAFPDISNDLAIKAQSEDKDEIFTLRDRKRKSVVDHDEVPIVNGVSLSSEEQARKEEKKRRKAGKRAEKEAAAAAAAQVQPFDYANAQSMLNPESGEQEQRRRKVANPYAKALNTSTGAKRTNQEGPGKSFTFKK